MSYLEVVLALFVIGVISFSITLNLNTNARLNDKNIKTMEASQIAEETLDKYSLGNIVPVNGFYEADKGNFNILLEELPKQDPDKVKVTIKWGKGNLAGKYTMYKAIPKREYNN